MFPEGYPETPRTERPLIFGDYGDALLYYANVDIQNGQLLTRSSRTLAFVGKGNTLEEAEVIAEKAASSVTGDIRYRRDIGTADAPPAQDRSYEGDTMKKDLLSLLDVSEDELQKVLVEAKHLKKLGKKMPPTRYCSRKTLAMIFEKPSTRTRLSFEVGMHDLGGHALYLNSQDLQIGRGEEIRDTARVASRYVSGIMIRAYKHQTIVDFAKYASIPVINGLSDKEHPCQIIADILTIWEHFGSTIDLKVAWVGDGNNVCNSLLLSSAITGMIINVASPPEFQPAPDLVEVANERGGRVEVMSDPYEAVKDADVIATDTWVSMGTEANRDFRLKVIPGLHN